MAARILLQRQAAPLTAALLVAGVAFTPRVAHAEAPESYNSLKKPIYDDLDSAPTTATLPPPKPSAPSEATSTTTTTLAAPATPASPYRPEATAALHRATHGPTPTDRLAVYVRDARLFLYRHACSAEDAVNRTMARAFHLEKSFTDTIASLAPPAESGETLMPGVVYVLVAAMAGSIVTRRSNILLRATVPAAFGVGMGWTVLPVTMRNVSDLAWTYEQRFPVVADSHVRTRQAWAQSIDFVKAHRQVAAEVVDQKVKSARETVEDWVKKGK